MANVHDVPCLQQQTPICSSQAINYSTLNYSTDGLAPAKTPARLPPSTAISLRHKVILEAPPAVPQRSEEFPLTYLNKGQYYAIHLRDLYAADTMMSTTVTIMFHEESHRKTASNYWKFWESQQMMSNTARAIDIDDFQCDSVSNIRCPYFDRVSFDWHGKEGATIHVRFNCLSTDFSRIKGVKGIPLRLLVTTQDTGDASVESTFCKIKLFRDKGAERKNKDDARHLERQLERMKGQAKRQPWLSSPVSTGLKSQSVTVFSEIPENFTPSPRFSSAKDTTDYRSTDCTAPAPVSSDSMPLRSLIMSRTPSPTATSFKSSAQPTINSPLRLPSLYSPPATFCASPSAPFSASPSTHPVSSSEYTSQRTKRRSSASSSTVSNRSVIYQDDMSPLSASSSCSSSVLHIIGIDPTYVAKKRQRMPELCLFVRFPAADYHCAIYLEKLTKEDLVSKLTERLNLLVSIKDVVRCIRRRKSDGTFMQLTVRVDDDMIAKIPDEEDMEVQVQSSADGTAILLLRY
ncbi:CP2 transcription factor-domain-containing protein [Syncephalastrum racemosum]|uniref:CP2 transcription factor-domain-containing protein n=1 Tax=Syncephalastrum racemosum TaxID=13706 RepID=A0A1X2HUH0_SYNRA|nr:CP2 transcription factor-domain-containing protein [Syncephalastrum racemosum]